MVRPTESELECLRGIKDGDGLVIYRRQIRDIENGFDVEVYYRKCHSILYPVQVLLLGGWYMAGFTTGLVLSREKCDGEYCYNVNQFLWVHYGVLSIGMCAIVHIISGRRWWDESDFMYYFRICFGTISHFRYMTETYTMFILIAIIVHIVYLSKSFYLRNLQVFMVLGNFVYLTLPLRYLPRMEQYYAEERENCVFNVEPRVVLGVEGQVHLQEGTRSPQPCTSTGTRLGRTGVSRISPYLCRGKAGSPAFL